MTETEVDSINLRNIKRLKGMSFEEFTAISIQPAIELDSFPEFLNTEDRGTKWVQEWLDYGCNTDANFLVVEETTSTMDLFAERRRRCYVGNLKTTHLHFKHPSQNPKSNPLLCKRLVCLLCKVCAV